MEIKTHRPTLENAAKMQSKLRYSEPAYYPRPVAEALGEEDLPGSVRSVNGLRELEKGSGVGAEY